MRNNRLERERYTIRVMIELYCRVNHNTVDKLCNYCGELFVYSMQRIDNCPYGAEKPTCAKCPIHCYKPEMREKIRQVMRYAGPRMILSHPILTMMHYVDEITEAGGAKPAKKIGG
jgi:hypothetical protein